MGTAFGDKLRQFREDRGLSPRELSQLSGVDHAYIFRLESGEKQTPSEEILTKLFRVLKIGDRSARLLRVLLRYPTADQGLIDEFFRNEARSIDLFEVAATMGFRGKRADWPTILDKLERIREDLPDERS